MSSTTTSLVTLPLLALISIPLAISACITICLSFFAILLQLSIISIELCYALFTNLFTIPPSTNWSLLSFAASEPASPIRHRSFDYGLTLSSPYPRQPSAYRQTRPPQPLDGIKDPQLQETSPIYAFDSRSTYPHTHTQTHRPNLPRNPSYAPSTSSFLGLTNGDEHRDFEGLGGWRCPPSSSKYPNPTHRSGRTSPSSTNSIDITDEADDIAWVSINSRLELPSQPLTLRNPISITAGSHTATTNNNNNNNATSPTEPAPSSSSYLPRRKSSRVAAADTTRRNTGSTSTNQRHHRRSSTTSMLLSGFSQAAAAPRHEARTAQNMSLGVAASMASEPAAGGGGGGGALRSRSHTSLSAQWDRMSNGNANANANAIVNANGVAGSAFFLGSRSGG